MIETALADGDLGRLQPHAQQALMTRFTGVRRQFGLGQPLSGGQRAFGGHRDRRHGDAARC